MINNELKDRIFRRIESYVADMIDLQIKLTAIPALSPDNQGTGEAEKADFLVKYLIRSGLNEIKELNAPDDRVPCGYRPNLLVNFPGKKANRKVWILTHMDIVPPGEMGLWSEDPYKGYVKDGCVYGRGTEDNQQDLVASVFAAKAFMDEHILPESSVGLAFVADEETSSHWGLDYILQHPHNPLKKEDLIVVPDSGEPDGSAIEIAEKSILWLRFTTKGVQCHGSRPSLGKNAFLASSYLIVELQSLYKKYATKNKLFNPPESTFQPTRKEGNFSSVNTIPGEDTFFMDCRILPVYDLKKVMHEIRRIADLIAEHFQVKIDIQPVQHVQAPPPTPRNAAIVRALKNAIKDVYQVRGQAVGIGAGTVAAVFRKYGYEAVVWSKLRYKAHQPDESCLIDNMVGNAKVFAHLMLQSSE
jgi:succinyl-diaminopimelate desuccinylase